MTADKNDPGREESAYQGAKPATPSDFYGGWGLFAGPNAPVANNAMSALLAENWWAIALRGVFAILFGLIALFLPGITLASLVLLFAAYSLVDGIFDIVAAVRAARRHERWGWLVLEGIADLIAAAIAFFFPIVTILAFVILMGVWAIVHGILLGVAAFRLHLTHGRGWMVFGGIISVIWGVLLLLWPMVGAIVLTWWMGAYAIIFGISLLVLAGRLFGHRHERVLGAQPAHST